MADAQQTYIVDSVGGSGAASSLTQLISTTVLQPGDVIQLIGRFDTGTGLPVPYSEAIGEIFPIGVPPGVKVMSYPGTQAIIGSNGSSGPGGLLQCPGIGVASQPTRIWDLWFVGGDPAISLEYNAQNQSYANWIDVRDCRFIGSRIGLSAIAENGYTLNVQVSNCDLAPQVPSATFAHPVQAFPFEIGLRFHALGSTTADGNVNAVVNGLDIVGEFHAANATGADAWPVDPNGTVMGGTEAGLKREVGPISRAIEVFSSGNEYPAPVSDPVPEVDLVVSGCSLDGLGASDDASGGWDVGILAITESEYAYSAEGFASGFDVTVTGTHVERFRHAGVVAVASAYARGHMNLTGNTVVKGTGPASQYSSPGFLGSGVYGYAYEGLLAITADECSFSDNSGHGVIVESLANSIADYEGDVGAFLGLEECKIHGNGGDGVSLYASWRWDAGAQEWVAVSGTSAIVGGTLRHDYTIGTIGTSLAGDPPDASLPVGPGYIRRCAISNNGGRGIFGTAAGACSSTAVPLRPKAVSVRVVNCAIWNNPLGGLVLLGDCGGFAGDYGPFLLVPLVHSTVAGNGSTSVDPTLGQVADYNVEVHEVGGYTPQNSNRYRYLEPTGAKISARINNCILQRNNPNHPDFGPTLSTQHGQPDLSTYALVPETRVAVEGVRAWGVSFFPALNYSTLTDAVVAWGGPVDWLDRDATQFVLQNPGLSGEFDLTPTFLHAAVADVVVDFFGSFRDTLSSGARAKGYDEY